MPLSKSDAVEKVPEEVKASEFYFDYKREDAVRQLHGKKAKYYLLRPSYSSKNEYHFAITEIDAEGGTGTDYYVKNQDGFHCQGTALSFKTLDELILHHNKDLSGLSNKPADKKVSDAKQATQTGPATSDKLLDVAGTAPSSTTVTTANKSPNNNGNTTRADPIFQTGKSFVFLKASITGSDSDQTSVSAPYPSAPPSTAPVFTS